MVLAIIIFCITFHDWFLTGDPRGQITRTLLCIMLQVYQTLHDCNIHAIIFVLQGNLCIFIVHILVIISSLSYRCPIINADEQALLRCLEQQFRRIEATKQVIIRLSSYKKGYFYYFVTYFFRNNLFHEQVIEGKQ